MKINKSISNRWNKSIQKIDMNLLFRFDTITRDTFQLYFNIVIKKMLVYCFVEYVFFFEINNIFLMNLYMTIKITSSFVAIIDKTKIKFIVIVWKNIVDNWIKRNNSWNECLTMRFNWHCEQWITYVWNFFVNFRIKKKLRFDRRFCENQHNSICRALKRKSHQ